MKNNRKRDQNSLDHLHEIESVGLRSECPLKVTSPKKSASAQVTEVVTWLKLQNHKMGYRLLYCDVVVCCAYIIFLFTALRFHEQVLPNRWFYGFTLFVLICSCILFIGVHLLPHTINNPRTTAKPLAENWTSYSAYFRQWPRVIGIYLTLLAIAAIVFIYNQNSPSVIAISLLLVITILLYGYGIKMIIKALQIKDDTKRYVVDAGKVRTVLLNLLTGMPVVCKCINLQCFIYN